MHWIVEGVMGFALFLTFLHAMQLRELNRRVKKLEAKLGVSWLDNHAA